MATHFSAGQYDDAYNPRNLQSWSLPRVTKAHPSAREGFTQFVANDRGHLLPLIPRSKTCEGYQCKEWSQRYFFIPAITGNAARLTLWINKSAALSQACNGLCPEIFGKPSIPVTKEAVSKPSRSASKQSERPVSTRKMPARDVARSRGATTLSGPLSRQPGSMDLRLKDNGEPDAQEAPELVAKSPKEKCSNEIPLSRQPGCMDVRLKDTSPQLPTPSRPSSREPPPRRTISAEAPPSGRPRSREGRSKGLGTPELLTPCRPGSLEVNPRGARSPEALPSGRPLTKSRQGLEAQKTAAERNAARPLSST